MSQEQQCDQLYFDGKAPPDPVNHSLPQLRFKHIYDLQHSIRHQG